MTLHTLDNGQYQIDRFQKIFLKYIELKPVIWNLYIAEIQIINHLLFYVIQDLPDEDIYI